MIVASRTPVLLPVQLTGMSRGSELIFNLTPLN